MSQFRNPFLDTDSESSDRQPTLQVELIDEVSFLGYTFESDVFSDNNVDLDQLLIRNRLYNLHASGKLAIGGILESDVHINDIRVRFETKVAIETRWKPGRRFNPEEEITLYEGDGLPESIYLTPQKRRYGEPEMDKSQLPWQTFLRMVASEQELPEYPPIRWREVMEAVDYEEHRANAIEQIRSWTEEIILLEQTMQILVLPVITVDYHVREGGGRIFHFTDETLKLGFTDQQVQTETTQAEERKVDRAWSRDMNYLKDIGAYFAGLQKVKKHVKRYGWTPFAKTYDNELRELLKAAMKDYKTSYFSITFIVYVIGLFVVDGLSEVNFSALLLLTIVAWQFARFLSYLLRPYLHTQRLISLFLASLIHLFTTFSLLPYLIVFTTGRNFVWIPPNYTHIAQLTISRQFSNLEKYLTTSIRVSTYNPTLWEVWDRENLFFRDSLATGVIFSTPISNNTWMVSNLTQKTFRNGDPIQQVKSKKDWAAAAANKQPAWCYPFNSKLFGVQTGILYNWYAVNDPRGLAPEGWRVATYADWIALDHFVGDDSAQKLEVPVLWDEKFEEDEYTIYTKKFGPYVFLAVPGFHRKIDGDFDEISENKRAYFWTQTMAKDSLPTAILMNSLETDLMQTKFDPGLGLYVRCVKEGK